MTVIPAPIQRGFDAILEPIVRRLIAARINPNSLTTVGTLVLLGSAVAYGVARARWGGALLLLSGAIDMLDGKVARGGGRITRFGAFYDSTLDRVGEWALFSGIAVFFLRGGVPPERALAAVTVALAALGSSVIVSYARARAEGLGLECKVGIVQRAERILVLGVPTLLFGAGPDGWLLVVIVAFLAATSVITIGQRIAHVHRITRGADEMNPPRGPARADLAGKGSSGR